MALLAGFMGIEVVFEEASMRLAVNLAPEREKGWEKWTGPRFEPGKQFSFELMMCNGLGPGELLFRQTGEKPGARWTASLPEAWSNLPGLQFGISGTARMETNTTRGPARSR